MTENTKYDIKFYVVSEEMAVPPVPLVKTDSKEAAVLHAMFKIWTTEMEARKGITVPYAEDLDTFLNAYNLGYLRLQINESKSQLIEA